MINFSIFGISSISTIYYLYKKDRPCYSHDIIKLND